MIKVLLLVILSFFALHAEAVVDIASESVDLRDFQLNYYVDKSQNMSFEEIQKQTFSEGKNRLSLGIHSHITWVKIILKNDTTNSKKLYIHNTYAYHASCTSFYAVGCPE